jgi:predicted transcriptional regulator
LVVNLFRWTEYRPFKQGAQTVLNPLESEIMEILWKEKKATARHVFNRLKVKHSMGRSAVNATMNGLCKRGLLSTKLSKGKGGLKYIYRIKLSRGRFEREVVDKIIDSLFESYKRTAQKKMKEKLRRV